MSSMASTSPKAVANNMDGERIVRNNTNILIGRLPEDFLRFDANDGTNGETVQSPRTLHQIQADEEVAMALQQQQYHRWTASPQNIRGRLDVTIVEARLVKNYGVTRMDPYVRLRIGHHIYETRTCYNGAKNPKWNKVFHCYLPQGVDSFHIEIYDECSFTVDEMIAWILYKIPESTFSGQTVEEWVDLNGKQGDGKEGQICVVTSFTPLNKTALQNTGYPVTAPMVPVLIPNQYGVVYGQNMPQVYVQPGHPPTGSQPQPQPQPQPIVISEEDVKQVSEMFPNVEIDVIKAIMETQRGNKDRTINSLLQMTSENN
ncbi:toll-interacting protein B-like [Oppia nitens]|uniref:toll-interacting protein B-like n=1 Tax=Oppia nitens TaxID=1686743 RepID=UPI0023DAD44D|nr:toll-interacting protein B-like [Oppia nitens]